MLKLSAHIIGLELELLSQVEAKEKNVYILIGASYLTVLLLAAISGSYLFYLIDDHIFSRILGAFVFIFLFGAIFRVLLVTNRDSILDTHTSTWKIRRFLPSMSGLLRFIIGLIFAIVLAFPLASAMNHKLVMRISEEKIVEVEGQMNDKMELLSMTSLEADLKHTHFPLTVFIELIESKKITPWLILVFSLITYQQLLLRRARKGKTFLYQSMAKQVYVEMISNDYLETITNGFNLAEKRFKVDLTKERSELDGDDMLPPFKVIPNPQKWNYVKDEELVKKSLGL